MQNKANTLWFKLRVGVNNILLPDENKCGRKYAAAPRFGCLMLSPCKPVWTVYMLHDSKAILGYIYYLLEIFWQRSFKSWKGCKLCNLSFLKTFIWINPLAVLIATFITSAGLCNLVWKHPTFNVCTLQWEGSLTNSLVNAIKQENQIW